MAGVVLLLLIVSTLRLASPIHDDEWRLDDLGIGPDGWDETTAAGDDDWRNAAALAQQAEGTTAEAGMEERNAEETIVEAENEGRKAVEAERTIAGAVKEGRNASALAQQANETIVPADEEGHKAAALAQQAEQPIAEAVEGSLLSDLEAVLGRNFLRGRLEFLEARLRPMFLSLPKRSADLVSHATARYALHRTNLGLHGWSITGLEPTVATFNTTSLVDSGIVGELLPPHIGNILKTHIGADGFGLRDLAVLAGTMEHMVHHGHRSILVKACELFGFPTMGPMRERDLTAIVRLYKALFLRGISTIDLTASQAKRVAMEMATHPSWVDAYTFVDDERNALAFCQRDSANPFKKREASLQIALQVVGRVADHYTHKINEGECQEIKENLLTHERGNTGRIRLVDFYRAGLNSRFFYTETKEYLQAIGALDESDELSGPKVIVANYVLAKANCLARTGIYSICCVNECEALYGKLERSILAADSTPNELVSLLSRFSSSTVQAPRNLSQTLRSRLEEIAIGNGGRVLLHSRLFAQWMHQAFPRECPYPHLVGTTTSLSPSAWAKQTGQEGVVDAYMSARIVLVDHIAALERSFGRDIGAAEGEGEDADLMWTIEEEYLVEPTRSLTQRLRLAMPTLPRWFSLLMMCCVVYVFVLKSRFFEQEKCSV